MTIVKIIQCLELKFIKKTEVYENDCMGNPISSYIEKLEKECNDE